MPAIKLVSRDLLQYNGTYGVLICRECQYAIQKSALPSHLLRHKIYRGERQRLLSSIVNLELSEPQDVTPPSSSSPPIEALPVIAGYCCTAAGCESLCASIKRMKRHWSEIHGPDEPLPAFSSLARPAKLQTFFRGTKLKYFEVAFSPAVNVAGVLPLITPEVEDNDDQETHGMEKHGKKGSELSTTKPTQVQMPPAATLRFSRINLDLEALTYFHHFTTTTSLTLPNAEYLRPTTPHWQTDVVSQALRRPWLMCGLLAISACHIATLTDDKTLQKAYHEHYVQLYSEFTAGWNEITKCDLGVVTDGVAEREKTAGDQISCMLQFTSWMLAAPMFDQRVVSEPTVAPQLESVMKIFRDFMALNSAVRPITIWSDDHNRQEEMLAQARGILEIGSSSDAGSLSALFTSNNTLSAILKFICALPYRMAETFGKPDNMRDVLATLSATAALVKCCEISFASDEVGAAWRGMAMWLIEVPNHFNHMVLRYSPAALVVLAHWAALLVQRAEDCGCWFLDGLSKTILLQIAARLPVDDLATQNLFRSLVAWSMKIQRQPAP